MRIAVFRLQLFKPSEIFIAEQMATFSDNSLRAKMGIAGRGGDRQAV